MAWVKALLDRRGLILFLRSLIGGFFILSAVLKLRLPVAEVEALIKTFQILPSEFTFIVALLLPWVELIPGILLVTGIYPLYGAAFIGGLTLFFIALLTYIIVAGVPVEDCGCLGGLIKETPTFSLVRDIFIITLLLPVIRYYRKR